jgi:hypothetical protein
MMYVQEFQLSMSICNAYGDTHAIFYSSLIYFEIMYHAYRVEKQANPSFTFSCFKRAVSRFNSLEDVFARIKYNLLS